MTNKELEERNIEIVDKVKGGKELPKSQRSRRGSNNKKNRNNSKAGRQRGIPSKNTSGSNDIRWYAANAELLKSAASIPFSNTTGQTTGFGTNHAYSVPGICSLTWTPTVANSMATMTASNQIYSFVVHANSRNKSYDAVDLWTLIVAGAQVFSTIAAGIRAYGLMRLYNQQNAYLPQALVQACGFDFADLKNNLSNMWFDLNQLIAQSTQIWIPNDLPFVERWFWMNSHVYMDSNSVKGQYYVFAPDAVFQYDEKETLGHTLQNYRFATNYNNNETPYPTLTRQNISWSQYVNLVQNMIDALVNSQDRGIIFGDILKAYGQDKIYTISPIAADYTVTPVYDPEVLTQIENATIAGYILAGYNQDITKSFLVPDWFNVPDTALFPIKLNLPPSTILNFHQMSDPTPEQIMVATRLKAQGTMVTAGTAENQKSYVPDVLGTEILTTISLYKFTMGGVISVSTFSGTLDRSNVGTVGLMYNLQCFDWAPWLYLTYNSESIDPGDDDISRYIPVGDADLYTVIDKYTLNKMHNTAVYSELGVPIL